MQVRDEQGILHDGVHGVPVEIWFNAIREANMRLSTSLDISTSLGIAKGLGHYCDDPDCARLNRASPGSRLRAMYLIVGELPSVRPADPTNTKERIIAEGHPWQVGKYLCAACARVAAAKRLLDTGWRPPQKGAGKLSEPAPGQGSPKGAALTSEPPTADGGGDA